MRSAAFLPFLLAPAAAMAQTAPAAQQGETPVASEPAVEAPDAAPSDDEAIVPGEAEQGEIIVVGERLRTQIDAAQQPIVTYGEEDIAAYGASSIADLLTATAPQTGSGRGRGGSGGGFPAILFNGQRISSFREMRNIPPEAIRRMEVLPEEVAVRYGFPPNQRVVNFILRDNFSARSLEGEFHLPTQGGFFENQFEGTLFKIDKASRLNLYLRANDASPLTEAERGVVQQTGTPDQSQYRTLIPDTRDIVFNTSWTTGLGEGAKVARLA